MRHFGTLLPLAALALGLLVSPAAALAQNLVVQSATEPPGLDLTATPASATAVVVFYNVQESLVKVDRHGKIVPWLAERWHTSDNKNYTFFLKRGVRFHNGRELRAADVKFVIDRAMNPETKHPYPDYYAAIGDIIVKDDYTITVTLKGITANFLLNMARQGSVVYPREAVDTLKSEPIGTGPFKLAEWVRGDRIVLVRNPDYHVKGLPKLDRVTYRFIPDPNAALAALKAGDIDAAMFGLGPEHVPELQKDARFQVIIGETTNDVIMSMNNSRKPYSDVRVRRAITHGINKPEVVKGAMFGLGSVLGTNVDPLNPYFVDMSGAIPYDPGKAKKLLAEAGYPNGFELELHGSSSPVIGRWLEGFQRYLADVGIRGKIVQQDFGVMLDRASKGEIPTWTLSHGGGPNCVNYLGPFRSRNFGAPGNRMRYKNDRVDALIDEAERTFNTQRQVQLCREAERLIVADAPWFFFNYNKAVLVHQPNVHGLVGNPVEMDYQPMHKVWIQPRR